MFVCHCRALTDQQIRAAVTSLYRDEPGRVITPSRVFRHLGARPDCGGCLPLFLRTMNAGPALVAPDVGSPGICCEIVQGLGLVCPVTHQACGEP